MSNEIRKKNAQRHINRIIDQYRNEITIPAVGAGLVIRDELVVSYVEGVRKHGTTHWTQPNDLFQLGSITKCMTGYLVGRLIDLGYLSWLTTIDNIHPDIIEKLDERNGENEKGWTNHYRNTTITDLMTHTSGIAGIEHFAGDKSANEKLAAINSDLKKEIIKKRKRFTQLFLEQRPFWGWKSLAGGALEKYASGATIVASMLERKLGVQWESLMETYVFKPLGITHYAFGPMSAENSVTNTWQHQIDKNGKVNSTVHPNIQYHWSWMESPVGGIDLSVGDFAKWIAAVITNPNEFLKTTTWEEYVSAPPGLTFTRGGWIGSNPRLTYNGSNLWSWARAVIDLKSKLGAFACINIDHDEASKAATEICAELETMGQSWDALRSLHEAMDPDAITVSADSTFNNMTEAPLVTDGLFRTYWASQNNTPTLTAVLNTPRMLKGVIICQAIAPRIQTFEIETNSGDSGATPQILNGQALVALTDHSVNGFVIRTNFPAPTKTKTLKLKITQSIGLGPRIGRLLLLEYDWTRALDLDINTDGSLWVADITGHIMKTSKSVEDPAVVVWHFDESAPLGRMVRKTLNFVYVLDSNNKIWRGKFGDWKQIQDLGVSKRMAVDRATDTVWSLDQDLKVRRHDGTKWIAYPGNTKATDIYVRDGVPFIIGTDGFVYLGTGNGWQKLPGTSSKKMVRLAVSEDGRVWAIEDTRHIFAYDPTTDSWIEYPGNGKGKEIAVYDNDPYVIGMDNGIWRGTGSKWKKLTVLQDKLPAE